MYSILSAAESIQILAVVGEAKPHTEHQDGPLTLLSSKLGTAKNKKGKEINYIIFNFQMQYFVCMECVLGHIIIVYIECSRKYLNTTLAFMLCLVEESVCVWMCNGSQQQ